MANLPIRPVNALPTSSVPLQAVPSLSQAAIESAQRILAFEPPAGQRGVIDTICYEAKHSSRLIIQPVDDDPNRVNQLLARIARLLPHTVVQKGKHFFVALGKPHQTQLPIEIDSARALTPASCVWRIKHCLHVNYIQ